jgi:hypothetical protein
MRGCNCNKKENDRSRTDDHHVELETLSHALTVDLVGKVSEADISHKFLANDGGDSVQSVGKGGT